MFSICFLNEVKAASKALETNVEYDKYIERNWAMVELASKLEQSIMDRYQIKEPFEDEYPSYFGGIYVSDDAKNLVIQIVEKNIPDDSTDEYKFYKKITNMDDSIKIEYVTHSFNELNEANNLAKNILNNRSKIQNDAIGSYIDVINNTTKIEMKNNNVADQNLFKKEIIRNTSKITQEIGKSDSKLITFEKQFLSSTFAKKYINAGGAIGNGGYCSMGFRARYYSVDGYVTAGHCVRGMSYIKEGKVKYAQFSNNQKYDYAFIQTDSDYVPTNNLEYPEINIMTLAVVKNIPKITVNMAIAKVGNKTEYTSGKVTGLNQNVYYDNEDATIYGLVQTNLKAGQGDSGGIIFIPRTDSNGGPIPIGVLSGGRNGIFGLGRATYFTSINDMHTPIKEGRY